MLRGSWYLCLHRSRLFSWEAGKHAIIKALLRPEAVSEQPLNPESIVKMGIKLEGLLSTTTEFLNATRHSHAITIVWSSYLYPSCELDVWWWRHHKTHASFSLKGGCDSFVNSLYEGLLTGATVCTTSLTHLWDEVRWDEFLPGMLHSFGLEPLGGLHQGFRMEKALKH